MKITILGAGHMGSWLARGLSEGHEIAIFDRYPEKTVGLANIKVFHDITEIASFEPEFLINVVSLQNTIPVFQEVLPHIPKGCVIGDMASVKGELGAFYEKSGFRFFSVHPMFGPTFANMDALKGENAIIIKESDDETVRFLKTFFEGFGIRIFEYTFLEHDKMMAYSLTLPFISSMAFASCVDSSAVPGTTFAKHMNIARGLLSEDNHLLGEVLFNAYSVPELDRVTAMMEYLKHIIRDRDHGELGGFLDRLRKNII
jgi:prephenate dehydrogenase